MVDTKSSFRKKLTRGILTDVSYPALSLGTSRYAESAEKFLLAWKTEEDVPAFVLRVQTGLCHCYSKV